VSDAFDSNDVALMSRALERAFRELKTSGRLDGTGEEAARATLTKGLIEAIAGGKRDEQELAAAALSHYQQSDL
jgi:hypothetical protein